MHRLAHRVDAQPHFLGARVAMQMEDARLVDDQIVQPRVDQVGNPEEHRDGGQRRRHQRHRECTRSHVGPQVTQTPEHQHGQQHEHRPDQERGEVLMPKLRAAERGALRDRREDGEQQQRGIQFVDAMPQRALDQIHRRDGDRQRAEDQMKFLEQHEVRERVKVQIFAERRDEIGERHRPHRVDDVRDGDERHLRECAEGVARNQIDHKRRGADQKSEDEMEDGPESVRTG